MPAAPFFFVSNAHSILQCDVIARRKPQAAVAHSLFGSAMDSDAIAPQQPKTLGRA